MGGGGEEEEKKTGGGSIRVLLCFFSIKNGVDLIKIIRPNNSLLITPGSSLAPVGTEGNVSIISSSPNPPLPHCPESPLLLSTHTCHFVVVVLRAMTAALSRPRPRVLFHEKRVAKRGPSCPPVISPPPSLPQIPPFSSSSCPFASCGGTPPCRSRRRAGGQGPARRRRPPCC